MRNLLIVLFVTLSLASSGLVADEQAEPGVLMLGGTRGVGLETVRLLSAQGTPVTVLVRPTSDLTELATTGANTVTGDAFNREDIDSALATGAFYAVVSTLSGKGADGQWVDSVGTINGIDAAGEAGVERFVLISSIGVGNSKKAMPWVVRKILGGRLAAKEDAEKYLAGHFIDYTVVRPGQLTNKPASGRGILTDDYRETGKISRAELARLIVAVLRDPEAIDKTYTAVEKK